MRSTARPNLTALVSIITLTDTCVTCNRDQRPLQRLHNIYSFLSNLCSLSKQSTCSIERRHQMRHGYKVFITLIIIIAFAAILSLNTRKVLNATEYAPPCKQLTDQGCITETICPNQRHPCPLDAAK